MVALLSFDCPRCHLPTDEEFYGPCTPCVSVLRAEQALNQTEVTATEYVPKMNVTPNAVASKE
jgi:hypothetical protein